VLPDESLRTAYDQHIDWTNRRRGLSKAGGSAESSEHSLLQWLRESVGWVDQQLLAAVPEKPFFRSEATVTERSRSGSAEGQNALLTSIDSLVARVYDAARSSVEEQWSQAAKSGTRQQDELLRTWKRRIEYFSRSVTRESGTGEEKAVQRRPVRVAETPSASVQPQKTWVEFQLVDDTGEPVPNAAYKVKLPDGSQKTGTLNAQGKVRFESIDPGQCQISFPDIHGSELKSA
jgi:hypothetical protein